MPAPAFLVAVSGLWRSFGWDAKKAESLSSAFSAVFGAQNNLHIALDDFAEPLGESAESESQPIRRGGGEGDAAWVEWVFLETAAMRDARFGRARWRFYASGLVVFNGELATMRGGLDRGDLLGHRIELRAGDGLLLGAWLAGFFVRPEAANHRYVSTAQIDHTALTRHFDDLAEVQTGQWFRRR
jgi:hypothetical protein